MNGVFSVALVGVGNIGLRHLQGLLRCQQTLNVFVVDPDPASRNRAREFFLSVSPALRHSLSFSSTQADFPTEVDVAIVATNSKDRLRSSVDLANNCSVGSWIFEKYLTNDPHQLDAFLDLTNGSKAWVNHPRRSMSWYQEIRDHLGSNEKIVMKVQVRPNSLLTSCIHFVDLAQWWRGSRPVEAILNVDKDGFVPSLRSGYLEASGTFSAIFEDGSNLTVETRDNPDEQFAEIFVGKTGETVEIQESEGRARFSDGRILEGRFELQSTLSGGIVGSIVVKHECELTGLLESVVAHRVVLGSLQQAWLRSSALEGEFVPVT